jgi:hypothetical protein
VAEALVEMQSLVVNLRVLGCYPSAEWNWNGKTKS